MGVAGPINLGTLHQEKETGRISSQEFDGFFGHVGQGGLLGGSIKAVDFRFQVAGGKEAKDFRFFKLFETSHVVDQQIVTLP